MEESQSIISDTEFITRFEISSPKPKHQQILYQIKKQTDYLAFETMICYSIVPMLFQSSLIFNENDNSVWMLSKRD